MNRPAIARSKPLVLPGFSAMLALLSLTSAPSTACAMGNALTKWCADLAPPDGDTGPHGSVVLEPGKRPNSTLVRVVISGDAPGALRPWYLYNGMCGGQGPIVGPEQSYARIRINARGNGVAVIELPVPFPEVGFFFVNVHESGKAMERIVTCGQLAR